MCIKASVTIASRLIESHGKLYSLELKFRMWFKYGLKAQKLQKQHALKGQKLLAQGIALGIM
ncbi:hypothetical protein DW064_15855, partial [Segatella copri]